jgi:hypothetical protein
VLVKIKDFVGPSRARYVLPQSVLPARVRRRVFAVSCIGKAEGIAGKREGQKRMGVACEHLLTP